MTAKSIRSLVSVITIATVLSWSMPAFAGQALSSPSSVRPSIYMQDGYQMTPAEKLVQSALKKVRTDIDSALADVQGASVRAYYESQAQSIYSDIRMVQWTADNEDSARTLLQTPIQRYKKLLQDIADRGTSFDITADETTAVETNIIGMQHDLVVSTLQPILSTLARDVHATGSKSFSIATAYGKATINTTQYTSIASFLSLSQEADFVVDADITANPQSLMKAVKQYVASQHPNDPYDQSALEDTTSAFSGIADGFHGHVMVDMNLKIINKDTYITLKDATITSDATDMVTGLALDKIRETIALYKGKTVRILPPDDASDPSSKMTPEMMRGVFQSLSKVLGILDSQSLLTPVRRTDSGYILGVRTDTVNALAQVFGWEGDGLTTLDTMEGAASAQIMYSGSGSDFSVYHDIDEDSAQGRVELDEMGGVYTLKGNIVDPEHTDTHRITFTISRDHADIHIVSDEIRGDVSYHDQLLNISGEDNDPSAMHSFLIRGPLSATGAHLAVRLDGAQIGSIDTTMQTTTDHESMDYRIAFDIKNIPVVQYVQVIIQGQETADVGSYPITRPTDVIDVQLPTPPKEPVHKPMRTKKPRYLVPPASVESGSVDIPSGDAVPQGTPAEDDQTSSSDASQAPTGDTPEADVPQTEGTSDVQTPDTGEAPADTGSDSVDTPVA